MAALVFRRAAQERRNPLNPAVNATSRKRASPAWAPSAGPLPAREFGTQSKVEAP